jgi:hypothetical protein
MKEFLSLFEDDDSWEASVDELCQFSLASYDYSMKALTLHIVIHACSHETVGLEDRDRKQVMAFLVIGRATPLGFAETDLQFRKKLWTHASYMYGKNVPTVLVCLCLSQILSDAGMWSQVESTTLTH